MKTILESSEIIAFLVKRYAKDKPAINFSIEKIYQIAQDVEVSSPSIFVDINRRSLEAFGTKYRKHINVKSHSIQIELNNESIKELLNDNIARKLIEGSNAKLMILHSGHNVSSSDFEKGITFLEVWQNNIEALKEGLL